MEKGYRSFVAIEFAFVASTGASFAALGIAGLLFGFPIRHWIEFGSIIAGMAITAAGLLGAVFGAYMALSPNETRLINSNGRET